MDMNEIDEQFDWSKWKPFPNPKKNDILSFPQKSGVYQLRNTATGEYVLFGIGQYLSDRMKSILPAPFGSGTRNNSAKRAYVLKHIENIEYRYLITEDRATAASVEKKIKAFKVHIFNT